MEDHLGAVHGEGRDHHGPTPRRGVADHLREAGQFPLLVGMDPVAVGRLDDDDVGISDGGRRPQQRVPGPAEITAEPDAPHAPVGLAHHEPHRRRAEDVTGGIEDAFDLIAQGDGRTHRHGRQQRARRLGIGLGVERQGRIVLAGPDPVGVGGLLLLESAAVAQQDLDERRRLRRARHPTVEAVVDEPGEISAVIDVGMGEDDLVDGGRIDRERSPVALPIGLETLEQAAVHQDPSVGRVDEEPTAGHRAGGTEELQRGRGRSTGHGCDGPSASASGSVPNVPISRRPATRAGPDRRASPNRASPGVGRGRASSRRTPATRARRPRAG